jgi:Asp-tRNA(Asn)/Glu-tRNA(Gln) amidotransferase C subunit
MQDDARETVRRLAAYAALPLAPERIEALAVTLPVISAGLAALAAFDYGDAEPADTFVPPRKEALR